MSGDLPVDVFIERMQRLCGEVIWSVIAGANTGSRLSIKAGGKRRRARPLRNRKLTDVERLYDGELSLYVECAWRLERGDAVVCASGVAELDDDDLAALDELRGSPIERVEIQRPALDCAIYLSNGLTLRLFCDQVEEDNFRDNYGLFTTDGVYTVGPRSVLSESDPEEI